MIFNTLINVTVQVSLTFDAICPGATTCFKGTIIIGILIIEVNMDLGLVRKRLQEELEIRSQY